MMMESKPHFLQPPVRVSLEWIRREQAVPFCPAPRQERYKATATLHYWQAEWKSDAGGGGTVQIPPMPLALQMMAFFCAGTGLGVVFLLPVKGLMAAAANRSMNFALPDLLWLALAGVACLAAWPWLGRRNPQPLLRLFIEDGTRILQLADGGAEWDAGEIDRWILVNGTVGMDIPESGRKTSYGDEGSRMGALLFTLHGDDPDSAVMVSRHPCMPAVLRQAARLAAEATSRPMEEIRLRSRSEL